MDNLIFALEDLLWWVQDGLDNADMTNREYTRTKNCRETVLKHISELKYNNQLHSTAKRRGE